MHTAKTTIDLQIEHLLKQDPFLEPYRDIIRKRLIKIEETKTRLIKNKMALVDFLE